MDGMKHNGFTLAELLIALVILGVIATFTLPKVLGSNTRQWNAAAKETVLMIDGAYAAYQMNNMVTASFDAPDLSPYMNYVSVQTSGTIDHVVGFTTITCDSTSPCLRLHNGGTLQVVDANMSGTSSTNATYFHFDPDGKYSGSTTGNGKALQLFLYYNGQITSRNYAQNPSCTELFCPLVPTFVDPNWFSWN